MTSSGRAVLVPVEDTEEALRALDWALKNFYREGDTFYLLHVVLTQRLFGSGLFCSSEPSSPLCSAEHGEALEVEHVKGWINDRFIPALEEARAQYKVLIMKAASSVDVGDVICEKAEELSAVLVVMTADKRGGVAAFYEGSNVQHCILNCHATILAWRPE